MYERIEEIRPIKRFVKTKQGLLNLDCVNEVSYSSGEDGNCPENLYYVFVENKSFDVFIIKDDFPSKEAAIEWIHDEFKNQIIEV